MIVDIGINHCPISNEIESNCVWIHSSVSIWNYWTGLPMSLNYNWKQASEWCGYWENELLPKLSPKKRYKSFIKVYERVPTTNCNNRLKIEQKKFERSEKRIQVKTGVHCSDQIQNLEKWIKCIICTVSKSFIHSSYIPFFHSFSPFFFIPIDLIKKRSKQYFSNFIFVEMIIGGLVSVRIIRWDSVTRTCLILVANLNNWSKRLNFKYIITRKTSIICCEYSFHILRF